MQIVERINNTFFIVNVDYFDAKVQFHLSYGNTAILILSKLFCQVNIIQQLDNQYVKYKILFGLKAMK